MVARDVGAVTSTKAAPQANCGRPVCVDDGHPHSVDLPSVVGSDTHASEAGSRPTTAPHEADVDDLAPARGLLLGILLGSAAWIAIGLAIWMLF